MKTIMVNVCVKDRERDRERGGRDRETTEREGGMSNTNNIPVLLLALPAALLHCLFFFFTVHKSPTVHEET